jgi:ERCC4-type nuclease
MDIKLLVDQRERKIFDHLDPVFNAPNTFKTSGAVSYEIQTLETGDYIIESDGRILAVIERKTLADYAASIKDGRSENKANLIKIRDASGCKIYYVIEGASDPALTKEFAGIKYSSILSSIRRLEITDSIHIIRTAGGLQTIQQLRFLCEIWSKMNTDDRIIMGTSEAIVASRPSEDAVLYKNITTIWKALPKISAISAGVLAKQYSIRELLAGIEGADEVRINSKKLTAAQKESLAAPDENKLLAAFPGLSKETAFMLLSSFTLSEIVDPENRDRVAETVVGKKKFGKKIDKIITLADTKL